MPGFFSAESLTLASAISGLENRGAKAVVSSLPIFKFIFYLLLLYRFQNKIILDPMTFSEARFRPSLEERLESIISGAALMADSSCTRDDRRERIVAECNAVRQALQDLLSEYMNNVSPGLLRRPHPTPSRALGKRARRAQGTGAPQRQAGGPGNGFGSLSNALSRCISVGSG